MYAELSASYDIRYAWIKHGALETVIYCQGVTPLTSLYIVTNMLTAVHDKTHFMCPTYVHTVKTIITMNKTEFVYIHTHVVQSLRVREEREGEQVQKTSYADKPI